MRTKTLPDGTVLTREDMLRTRELGDGTRAIEWFTLFDDTPAELLKDANWQTVMDVKPGEVFSGFVRLSADVRVAEHPRAEADGVIVEIAGTRFGIPTEQAETLIAGLTAAVAAKKAKPKPPGG